MSHAEPKQETIWRCGECGIHTTQGPEVVVNHCKCSVEGCGEIRDTPYRRCREHVAEHRLHLALEYIDGMTPVDPATIPKTEQWFVHNTDQFVVDLDEVLEDWSGDLANLVVSPCAASKAPSPDLMDWITEVWAEPFTDPEFGIDAAEDIKDQIGEWQTVLWENAPRLFTPTHHRLILEGMKDT